MAVTVGGGLQIFLLTVSCYTCLNKHLMLLMHFDLMLFQSLDCLWETVGVCKNDVI